MLGQGTFPAWYLHTTGPLNDCWPKFRYIHTFLDFGVISKNVSYIISLAKGTLDDAQCLPAEGHPALNRWWKSVQFSRWKNPHFLLWTSVFFALTNWMPERWSGVNITDSVLAVLLNHWPKSFREENVSSRLYQFPFHYPDVKLTEMMVVEMDISVVRLMTFQNYFSRIEIYILLPCSHIRRVLIT